VTERIKASGGGSAPDSNLTAPEICCCVPSVKVSSEKAVLRTSIRTVEGAMLVCGLVTDNSALPGPVVLTRNSTRDAPGTRVSRAGSTVKTPGLLEETLTSSGATPGRSEVPRERLSKVTAKLTCAGTRRSKARVCPLKGPCNEGVSGVREIWASPGI